MPDLVAQATQTLDERPVIEILLTLWDGDQIRRVWTWHEVQTATPAIDPQPWMLEPRKTWPHPQSPITFEAAVSAADEDDARAWLKSL